MQVGELMYRFEELANTYETDGVVRVPRLFTSEELNVVREGVARYEGEVAPGVPESDRVYEADGRTLRNLWRMEQHDEFFHELAHRTDLVGLVGELVKGEPVLAGVETFNKQARVGSGVPPHQDNAYFCRTPPDMLTVWVAIDAATEANGPIYYVRGSHTAGVLPHKPSGVKGNSMVLAESPAAPDGQVFVGTLEPGDALIHHCQTIHYSGPNETDASRCGLLLVYHAAHAERDPELLERYQAAQTA
jgi:hypothetical protein